jgi:DNA polymerase-3 subunit alpha
VTDGFVHLHNHTEYSLLDGEQTHKDMAAELKRIGQTACAITDHGNNFGSYSFHKALKSAGLKPIIGQEAYVAPGSRKHKKAIFWGPGGKRAEKDADGESGDVSGRGAYTHMTILARNSTGLRSLYELGTRAFTEGQYPRTKGRMDRELLSEVIERDGQNLIATTGCPGGEVQTRLRLGQYDKAVQAAAYFRDLFGPENYFLEIMDHGLSVEKRTRADLLKLGKELGIRPLATNDSHYARQEDAGAHDALLCVGTGKNLAETERFKFDGTGYYLKSAAEMRELFDAQVPGACDNTLLVAEMVESYDEVFEYRNRMPQFPVPEGYTEETYLWKLVREGELARYGSTPDPVREARLQYEMGLVIKMGFAGYFLAIWDVCRFMRENGIRFAPRGSAAGSAVIYTLFVGPLDPLRFGLLFERFINPERVSPPDVDLDIDERRRGEVIEYVYRKYGHDRVSQVITFGRLQAKGALKDSARIHGFGYGLGDQLAKLVPPPISGFNMPLKDCFDPEAKRYEEAQGLREMRSANPDAEKAIETALVMEGNIRDTGVHACAVMLSSEPMLGQIPMYLQEAKDKHGTDVMLAAHEYPDLEAMGLQKMDFLGLRNWTVVDDTVKAVEKNHGVKIDLEHIEFDDPAVYESLGRGETLGVFQLEGGGMQTLLRLMKPTEFEDIMAVGALYRPGPMKMESHTNYALRKNGRQEISPIHPELEEPLREVLAPTQGVICFQEQVMTAVQIVAGYSLGQADLLRKAMGKKKKEVLEKEFGPYSQGMKAKGYSDAAIMALWKTLEPFAEYAFNRAHTACYGALAYWTAWLKLYYPAEYMAALLTSVEDKDKMAIYLAECRRLGLSVLVPDVNESEGVFVAKGKEIRFGLDSVSGVGAAAVEAIVQGRQERPYDSFLDYLSRVPRAGAAKPAVIALIEAGGFDSLGVHRRALAMVHEPACVAAVEMKKKEDQGAFDLFGEMLGTETNTLEMAGITIDPESHEWSKKDAGEGAAGPVRLRPPARRRRGGARGLPYGQPAGADDQRPDRGRRAAVRHHLGGAAAHRQV